MGRVPRALAAVCPQVILPQSPMPSRHHHACPGVRCGQCGGAPAVGGAPQGRRHSTRATPNHPKSRVAVCGPACSPPVGTLGAGLDLAPRRMNRPRHCRADGLQQSHHRVVSAPVDVSVRQHRSTYGRSVLNPYKIYLLERWNTDSRMAMQLFRDLQPWGCTRSYRRVAA